MGEENINHNEEEILGKAYDAKLMKRLLKYAKKYWKLFAVAVLLLFVSTITDLARPYLIKVAIDDYINGYTKPMVAYSSNSGVSGIEFDGMVYKRVKGDIGKLSDKDLYSIVYVKKIPYLINGYFNTGEKPEAKIINSPEGTAFKYKYVSEGREFPARQLTGGEIKAFRSKDINSVGIIGLLFIGIIIAGFVFNFLQIYILSYTGQTIIFNIRQEVFTHLQRMSIAFFDKNPVGRLVTRVTNDTETLNDMYTNVLVSLLKDVFILIGVVIIMLQMNVMLALITVAFIPLIVLVTAFFRVKARAVYRRVRVTLARINSVLSENISGMRVIQIFSKEKKKLDEFKTINNDYYKAGMDEVVVFGIFRPLIEMLAAFATALILWFGGGQVVSGALQFGVLFAFVNYIGQFFQPVNDLAEKYNILQSAMASSERIFGILDTPVESDEGKVILNEASFKGNIEFKNVWFAYKENEWVLRDVSFIVPAGKSLAIVGATGAGKTSIINLINRFYEIQKGEILIDGVNICDIKKDSLRKIIGMVLQDVFLFSGTVKDNIKLSEEGISDEEIEKVAAYVNADRFIKQLPKEYNEEVMERGATFSSGQRQLLAFARALAFKPAILILDEATASIDTETEILIQDAVTKLTANRTTIVIAHRLSTIQHADNIIVLHKGKVREMGNHQELLARKGIYHNLYQLQYRVDA